MANIFYTFATDNVRVSLFVFVQYLRKARKKLNLLAQNRI